MKNAPLVAFFLVCVVVVVCHNVWYLKGTIDLQKRRHKDIDDSPKLESPASSPKKSTSTKKKEKDDSKSKSKTKSHHVLKEDSKKSNDHHHEDNDKKKEKKEDSSQKESKEEKKRLEKEKSSSSTTPSSTAATAATATIKKKPQKGSEHEVAGLNCDKFGGPSEEEAAEMVYWRDIPHDANFVSPYANYGPSPKYLTFEPDEGGWNNIRMSMETAVVLALAMGRTLVLPFTQHMYLLAHAGKKEFTFRDFFHFDSIADEHPALDVITMEEFVQREIMAGNIRHKETGRVIFPPNNQTSWDGHVRNGKLFWHWFRNATHTPMWNFDECIVGFAKEPGKESADNLKTYRKIIPKHNAYSEYTNNPIPVDAVPQARFREALGSRKKFAVYGPAFQNAKVVHFMGDNDSGARLLTHFYSFLFFEDYHHDLWTKRFVRDHLRYVDEIQCASARIVAAVRKLARKNGSPDGIYDSFHIRRGDFQYKNTRIDAEEIYQNVYDVLEPNSTIFIATDERDLSFFKPLTDRYYVYFLKDFMHLIKDVDKSFYGMIDQRIASRARTFVGVYYSTFTGYINRMRGYHAQKDKLSGSENGEINSYYYIPTSMKSTMRVYMAVHPPFWAREFPVGWRNLDYDLEEGLIDPLE